MIKFANVIYNYSPKNDDELELKEGDEIEVLGFEEEGWWKGKLRGRIGVFPSNFVKVVDVQSSPGSQPVLVGNQSSNLSPQSKLLNLLGKNSKTSLSSNSLNSNNSNNTSGNNNNNYNHQQTMNNTPHQQQQQQQQQQAASIVEDPSASERRPKPIRGIGFGDIFAAGAKPKLSLGSDIASNPSSVDRISSNLPSTLQKQIPKKPPPPAPANATDDNNSGSTDQAPALPPKPGNQFGSHLHHLKPYPPPPTTTTAVVAPIQQSSRREQARVIYAYDPSNDDELALEVGDVIDILDKEIEDQGWWKGELKGKIGVFPDNFVQLIEAPEPSNPQAQGLSSAPGTMASPQDWNPRTSNQPSTVSQTIEGKIKSVFDSTPKGFSKELENNLVKQNNSASFLSLKRNKLQQMATSESIPDENGKKDDSSVSSPLSYYSIENTPKLNHITANRAKGPSRRLPTNLLNKRTQSEPDKPDLNGKDEPPVASLPVGATSLPVTTNHDNLSSLPIGQNKISNNSNSVVNSIIGAKLSPSSRPVSENILHQSIVNSSQSIDTVTDNHVITPKTSQRLNQQPNLPDKNPKPATTPSWMLELKKAHAEKRRDNPTTPVQAPTNELADTKPTTIDPPVIASSATTNSVPQLETQVVEEKRPSVQSVRGSYEPSTPTTSTATATVTSAVKSISSRHSMDSYPVPAVQKDTTNEAGAHYESLIKQISNNFQSEINELKDEIKRLRIDFQDFRELRSVVEVMKIELKACQSATESQKRWMKDLVDNLADERKKIAAMQSEIDRNLK